MTKSNRKQLKSARDLGSGYAFCRVKPTRVQAIGLTRREARLAIRLLGVLQTHLESAIESCTVPGQTQPFDEIDRANVREDRRDWKAAEGLVKRLEGLARKGAR
jgi:hypothetical protein